MARANRHHIPGQVWHITHRCHKKEFLLKFARDRRSWHSWLFEARKRFGLRILNYVVTSNHIHLLVIDSGPDVIPRSLQLIAGRTAQEFNNRKERKGAYWEDRYHATAVERNEHLISCLVYIDLNMVRAGVVSHPAEWEMNGYNGIQSPPKRYGVIDLPGLQNLCDFLPPSNLPSSISSGFMRLSEQAKTSGKIAGPKALPLAAQILSKRSRPGSASRDWGEGLKY